MTPPRAPWRRLRPAGRDPSLIHTCGLGAICGWLLVSCAAQSPPQPPRLERPLAVRDLAVHQVGRTIEISFTLPTVATDGERLTKPLGVEISCNLTSKTSYVTRGVVGQIVVDFPPDQTGKIPCQSAWALVDAAELPRLMHGPKVLYRRWFPLEELVPLMGKETLFDVRTYTRGFRGKRIESETSNKATLTVLDTSAPVENLKIESTQHAIKLTWSPPAQSFTRHPPYELAGYHVYRSESGKPDTYQLAGETLAPAFADANFQFGETYHYKVRAVFKESGQVAESDDSIPAVITPRDVFPPAAPAGLTGLYTSGVVELIWNANTESDLAGYNVYRSEAAGGFRRLNTALVPTPIFRDRAVTPGGRYAYRVTAVDRNGNESAPRQEVVVDAR